MEVCRDLSRFSSPTPNMLSSNARWWRRSNTSGSTIEWQDAEVGKVFKSAKVLPKPTEEDRLFASTGHALEPNPTSCEWRVCGGCLRLAPDAWAAEEVDACGVGLIIVVCDGSWG